MPTSVSDCRNRIAWTRSGPFAGGDGSVSNPYIIESSSQLDAVHYYLDKCFALSGDIVFDVTDFAEGGDFYNGGKGWIPIGEFTGIFDGCGYEIKGLAAKSDTGGGLFGNVSGTIKNLGLTDFDIECVAAENVYPNCGSVSAYLSGTMVNCYTRN